MTFLIHEICGYKKTGKDTLHKLLLTNKFIDKKHVSFFGVIYEYILELLGFIEPYHNMCSVFGSRLGTQKTHIFTSDDRTRVSFADELKNEVHNLLSNDGINIEEITDELKDIGKYTCSELNITGTLRDMYIEHGRRERQKDPNIWIKKTLNKISKCNSFIVDITDWRFVNEYSFFKMQTRYPIITTRVFRSCVSIPAYNISSEHDLDGFITDFVLVKSRWDFLRMVWLMPLYWNHKYIGTIG